ncbi:MAG: tRNA pseudouridine(55) synthase TruB [Clostridia bacterium]|nr:tRNA pseudouridine(55) synthase TruB [Clostridia bacterium]
MIGFVNIYKPSGMTSSAVVVKLRKKINIKKIGHMGTLDPMACGILPIAIGKATRMFDYFLDKVKTYKAVFQFGILTDTLDIEGQIVKTSNVIPTKNQIDSVLNMFLGEIDQIPPDFSAKSVGGVKAYKLARQGQKVELRAKKVEIIHYECIRQIDESKFEFIITCSSGTYIRSLARDLGECLGTVASMCALERVESGVFNLNNSYKLEDVLNDSDINSYIISIDKVFPKIEVVEVSNNDFSKLKNGVGVKTDLKKDIYLLKYNNEVIGVGEVNNGLLSIKTYLME